ncbi:MAG TPA: SDR family NAD(P)-dependent oxidoreductase [Nocardioidaceae bacterium]|nr:SDR family NAD(P)-dependent oxidoreductase [Nocardioidaceae bacterium]
MKLTNAVDTLLDRSIVLGYSRVGSTVRRLWWPEDPPPGAMAGKRALVTGATSGIGKETAAGLARLGAEVHVLGRSPEKLEATMTELRGDVPGAVFVAQTCDLSSLADVRRFCADFRARVASLHALIHNAGSMAQERTETEEGHEQTLATHVLGPHLMTYLLHEPLAAAEGASVLFMSSGGMYPQTLRDDDPEFRTGRYSATAAYARAKRMQVVLTQMWAERLLPDRILVESMHPGWVDTAGVATYLPKFRAVTRPLLRDAGQGADTMVWLAATRPTSAGSRHFWHDRRLRPTSYGKDRDQDAARRQRLWDYVAAATGTGSGTDWAT